MADDPEVAHANYEGWAIADGRIVFVGRGGAIGQHALLVSTAPTP